MSDMFVEPPKVERPPDVHCPFCGWHRLPDLSKTAGPPDGFQERAEGELVEHLSREHPGRMMRLVERWQHGV